MRTRDHIIAAVMAIGVMALSLTVGRAPETAERPAPTPAESAVRR